MRYLDLTLATAAEDLALDEALLLEAEEGRGAEVLRVWERGDFAVVLGAGGWLAEEVEEENCARDHVPILRRNSGGGAVLLGPGCLVFSLILSYQRSPFLTEVRPSHGFILGRVRDALNGLVAAERCGTSDLAVGDLKISGNSQQRKQRFLLHHGTLLHGLDLARAGRYLKLPARQPAYRRQRGHQEFLHNLPCGAAELCHRLQQAWQADQPLSEWPHERTRQLVADKYGRPEWTRRR